MSKPLVKPASGTTVTSMYRKEGSKLLLSILRVYQPLKGGRERHDGHRGFKSISVTEVEVPKMNTFRTIMCTNPMNQLTGLDGLIPLDKALG